MSEIASSKADFAKLQAFEGSFSTFQHIKNNFKIYKFLINSIKIYCKSLFKRDISKDFVFMNFK